MTLDDVVIDRISPSVYVIKRRLLTDGGSVSFDDVVCEWPLITKWIQKWVVFRFMEWCFHFTHSWDQLINPNVYCQACYLAFAKSIGFKPSSCIMKSKGHFWVCFFLNWIINVYIVCPLTLPFICQNNAERHWKWLQSNKSSVTRWHIFGWDSGWHYRDYKIPCWWISEWQNSFLNSYNRGLWN